MEDHDLRRRAEIARRLKAARWLAGGVRRAETGRAGYEVYALDAKELAAKPGMAENQITASKIGSIERMERHTPPMEVEVLARGLGVSPAWLAGASGSQTESVEAKLDRLTALVAGELRLLEARVAVTEAEAPQQSAGIDRANEDPAP